VASSLAVGIGTQTPLLKFDAKHEGGGTGGGRTRLMKPRLTPGGVCRMVLPTLRHWDRRGLLRKAHWLSLQPSAPPLWRYEGLPLELHHLSLAPDELAAYARTKEKLWADIHGLPAPAWHGEDFRFYARYNWLSADRLMGAEPDLDVVYVQDFQLLQVGGLVGLSVPSVFRWHVPLVASRIPEQTRNFLLRAMEAYDGVIVSTRRDLEGLMQAGYRGRAHQIYPHIDPKEFPDPDPEEVARIEQAWGLGPDTAVILVVARMDPMKRQDLAIQALAQVRRAHPDTKLVLVGNGSFSGKGGLGLDKAGRWRAHLEEVARRLGQRGHVVFAHWVPEETLAAAYARATVVALPSDTEGFGLTILEGWRYGRPGIASRGAGCAEIIHEGLNGHTFAAGNVEAFARRVARLVRDPGRADDEGRAGKAALRMYAVANAARREREALLEAIGAFWA
jgi:glycosyltransferase involved in cell wall biosynthesis